MTTTTFSSGHPFPTDSSDPADMDLPVAPTPDALRAEIKAAIKAGSCQVLEWEVAFHEAGHVVTEVRIGRSYPDWVHLNDARVAEDDHAGRMRPGSFVEVTILRGEQVSGEIRRYLCSRAESYGAVLAAGYLAELLARGHEPNLADLVYGVTTVLEREDGSSDERELLDIAQSWASHREGATFDEEIEVWIKNRMDEALACLRVHWSEVELVARALVGRRGLERDDLVSLLR